MPKRKRPEDKPEEQFERFIQTAREVEVDETGKALERTFKSITGKAAQKKRRTAPDENA